MSNLLGNPEDRFSCVAALMITEIKSCGSRNFHLLDMCSSDPNTFTFYHIGDFGINTNSSFHNFILLLNNHFFNFHILYHFTTLL